MFLGEDINATRCQPLPAVRRAPVGRSSWIVAAAEVPLAIVDGELGRVVQGPTRAKLARS